MAVLKLIAIFTIGLSATALAIYSPERDLENLKTHLGEIRAIADEHTDPCSNFPKYACGNFDNSSSGENYPNDRVYLSDIADDLQRLKDIKLQATHKAKTFLESCMKYQNPKYVLQKVDVFKNPTQFKLAKALGILKSSGINTILRTNINALGENVFRIIISLDHDLFLSSVFSESNIQHNLNLLDVNPARRAEAEQSLLEFIQKGKAILANSKETPKVGNDPFEIKNFDWNEYLGELRKLPNLSDAAIEFVLEDIVNLQKIIDLVSETDLQVLRLVTALELMAEVIDSGCDMVVDYFRMPLFAEFYRMYFKESDKIFNLDVLKEFEKSQSSIKSKLGKVSGGSLSRVQEKQKIIENMDKILDSKRIDAEYKDVVVEKDNFYQNYLNVNKFKIVKYLSRANSKMDFAEEYLLNVLNPVNRMKPVFYHFATQGLYLWQLFFRENSPKYSYDDLRDCLEAQQDKYKLFEFNDLDYFAFVEDFAAAKQTFLDFKRYWEQDYDASHKLDTVFQENHLTKEQAFFLNLAQRECARVDDGRNIQLRIMLNMEDVSKAFNCPIGSHLNLEEKCAIW